MDRADLEQLDRDALIARAEAAGVQRPSILTRPELVDELLLRMAPRRDDAQVSIARGLFGRARDLLARVIERGLHLPDAADAVRQIHLAPPPPLRTAPSIVPTVTLAEIYAAQGHRARAVDTLRRVLEQEPEHGAARSLMRQLEDESYTGPAEPALPPEEEEAAPGASGSDATERQGQPPREPFGFLDDAPLPEKYDVDECVALPVDPTTLFVYWEVRDVTLAHLRGLRPDGGLALRALVILPTWEGPRTEVRDIEVSGQVGDWFVRDLPAGSVVRTAIGWRSGDVFLPVAHSPALETPPNAPSPIVASVLLRWTPQGAVPVEANDADARAIAKALGRYGVNGSRRRGVYGGSSELPLH